jgi:hypothetical protein
MEKVAACGASNTKKERHPAKISGPFGSAHCMANQFKGRPFARSLSSA